MVSVVLSRSGKALLFYAGDGSVWVTSVRFMELLLGGELKGGLLVLKELGGAVDKGRGSLSVSGKVVGVEGDVLL